MSFATNYRVDYQDYELHVASDNYYEKGFRVQRNEGTEYIETITESSAFVEGRGNIPSRNRGDIRELPFDVQVVYELEGTVPYVEVGFISNKGMSFLSLSFMSIVGVFLILLPDITWKVEHFLWVAKGEPSELYLGLHITGGILALIIVFVTYYGMMF